MLCLERVENKCSEEDSKRKSGEKIFCLMEREHSLIVALRSQVDLDIYYGEFLFGITD
jgi:hypothetical protein